MVTGICPVCGGTTHKDPFAPAGPDGEAEGWYRCPLRYKVWHMRAEMLVNERDRLYSPRLKALVQQDIDEIVDKWAKAKDM